MGGCDQESITLDIDGLTNGAATFTVGAAAVSLSFRASTVATCGDFTYSLSPALTPVMQLDSTGRQIKLQSTSESDISTVFNNAP